MKNFLLVLVMAVVVACFVYFDFVQADAFILLNFVIGIVILLFKLSQATVKKRKMRMDKQLELERKQKKEKQKKKQKKEK